MYEVRVPGLVLRDSVGGRAPGHVCGVCSCTCVLVVRDSVGHAVLNHQRCDSEDSWQSGFVLPGEDRWKVCPGDVFSGTCGTVLFPVW